MKMPIDEKKHWTTSEKLEDRKIGIFADVEKINDNLQRKLRDRICCKVCGFVIFVGLIIASVLLISLVLRRLQPIPIEERCGLGCALRAASWANFSEMELYSLGLKQPRAVLDALSSVYVERLHALEPILHDNGETRRLKDAHRRLAKQMQDLAAKHQRAKKMTTSQEKADLLKEIVVESKEVEELSREVSLGSSWGQARTKQLSTEAEATTASLCADVLRKVSIDDCGGDPGTTTDFLRAVGVGSRVDATKLTPTWPIDVHYPGLRTLDADHGIHTIDGFLSSEEIAQLMKSTGIASAKNHSQNQKTSFAEVHTLSSVGARADERIPKWMYSGMPGALIQLDIQEEAKGCRPRGDPSKSEEWVQVLQPFFKAKGQDLQTCERSGFGDTQLYNEACPNDARLTSDITSRIGQLMQSGPEHLQPLALKHYGKGDFDFDHYDNDIEVGDKRTAHLFTVMIYLTSAKGGGTYFPQLDLRVDPKPGRALLFPTSSMNLSINTAALHAEEEVKRGDKWVLSTTLFLGRREDLQATC